MFTGSDGSLAINRRIPISFAIFCLSFNWQFLEACTYRGNATVVHASSSRHFAFRSLIVRQNWRCAHDRCVVMMCALRGQTSYRLASGLSSGPWEESHARWPPGNVIIHYSRCVWCQVWPSTSSRRLPACPRLLSFLWGDRGRPTSALCLESVRITT